MNTFNSTLKTAWLILSLIDVGLFLKKSHNLANYGGAFGIIGLVCTVFYVLMVVFSLSKMATKDGFLKEGKIISVWGYVWRASVVRVVAVIPTGAVVLLLFGKGPYAYAPINIFISILYALMSLVVIWAIFSKDRKAQINWLIALGRGY